MAAGAPRIFVSHLAGVPVFDPTGDQVGRVRDLVVMLRVGKRPPRLLGLVVELATRRRIFLPMTRVTGIESGQVITTGVLNVRRFEQRPTETLVLGELLDRRVRLVETGEEVTVLDVSVQQLPARRDWEVDRVFVRKGRKGGAFRRAKGETLTVEWSAVTGFSLEEHGQGAESLLATFEQLRPADLANVLHHLSAKRRGEVAAAVREVAPIELVNGGGTGSLERTAAEEAVTEVTAGSGFFAPTLFDAYSAFELRPAAMFALPVVRKPAAAIATSLGGGYLASGAAEASRLPSPYLPAGLRLDRFEGAGEVQTPLRGPAARSLRIGDRVWMRHAKGASCVSVSRLSTSWPGLGSSGPRRPIAAKDGPFCDCG
jgi:sporulation protein YlmC with PRC-barrel domain